MLITGISPAQFREIVTKVSHTSYSANLLPEIGREYVRADGSVNRFHARVIPLETGARSSYAKTGRSAPGARRSWSGRRIKASCWHAYRDVLAALFDVNPAARVKTAMADYNGRDAFYDRYPATAHRNIGSMMQPAHMPDMCDCDLWGISTHEHG